MEKFSEGHHDTERLGFDHTSPTCGHSECHRNLQTPISSGAEVLWPRTEGAGVADALIEARRDHRDFSDLSSQRVRMRISRWHPMKVFPYTALTETLCPCCVALSLPSFEQPTQTAGLL